MKKLLILSLLFLSVSHAALAEDKKLHIVASFSVLGDMAATVGGADITIKTLVGPDGDAHTYQPTPDDAKAMAHADIIFVNGLGLEGWMQRLIEASGTHARVVTASNGITPRTMIDNDSGKTEKITDPHAWQNLANAHVYIKNIADALTAADPAHAQTFKDRAAKFDGDVTEMDASVHKQINTVPVEKRKIITSHDAFGYFGAAYGVTFIAPEGLSTEAEPSAATIARLTTQIKKEKVRQVFVENMADPRLITQMAKDSDAALGGTLYSDALSPPNGAAPHYLEMFRNNMPKLVAAMQQNGT